MNYAYREVRSMNIHATQYSNEKITKNEIQFAVYLYLPLRSFNKKWLGISLIRIRYLQWSHANFINESGSQRDICIRRRSHVLVAPDSAVLVKCYIYSREAISLFCVSESWMKCVLDVWVTLQAYMLRMMMTNKNYGTRASHYTLCNIDSTDGWAT